LKDDTETIRIISARQASRKEREAYQPVVKVAKSIADVRLDKT